jgi:hypothetical protein
MMCQFRLSACWFEIEELLSNLARFGHIPGDRLPNVCWPTQRASSNGKSRRWISWRSAKGDFPAVY